MEKITIVKMSEIEPRMTNHQEPSQRSPNEFHFRRRAKKIYPIILLIMGVLQYYVFWFLYYTLELHILACVSMIAGTIMQIVGLIKLYMGAQSANAAKWLIGIIVGFVLLWAWYFFYYGSLILKHLSV